MAKQYNKASKNNSEAYEQITDLDGIAPPQAPELEQAVLGALMLEKDAIISVQEYINVETFYLEEHRLIFKAIQELSLEMKAIDLYTVTERLKSQKLLTKAGGAAYLAQLTQRVASSAHVEFHAKIIAQKYVQRELIRSATEIQRRSYDEEVDVTGLIGFAEREIFKVSEGNVKRSVLPASDILRKALSQIEEAAKTAGEYNGVRSGFTDIDSITLG
jgi:replicative DNA helicase